MIGNPTNPTGVLHPAARLRALLRPGRVVVVDEAFMDAVPGEPESLAAEQVPGLLVLRSLTKTWGIAGLRAGYVVGDAELIARLAEHQPPWSVSSPALAAITACCADDAVAEAALLASAVDGPRAVLIDGLRRLGLSLPGHPATPFVLADTAPVIPSGAPPGWIRTRCGNGGSRSGAGTPSRAWGRPGSASRSGTRT